jgi:hypothetical protein
LCEWDVLPFASARALQRKRVKNSSNVRVSGQASCTIDSRSQYAFEVLPESRTTFAVVAPLEAHSHVDVDDVV